MKSIHLTKREFIPATNSDSSVTGFIKAWGLGDSLLSKLTLTFDPNSGNLPIVEATIMLSKDQLAAAMSILNTEYTWKEPRTEEDFESD